MVFVILNIIAAVEAVEAERVAESERIDPHRMLLRKLGDELAVALYDTVYQRIALFLRSLRRIADNAKNNLPVRIFFRISGAFSLLRRITCAELHRQCAGGCSASSVLRHRFIAETHVRQSDLIAIPQEPALTGGQPFLSHTGPVF